MGDVKKEVNAAIKTLALDSSDITLLADDVGKRLYYDLLNTFVQSGDRRWWWEDFKYESVSIDHLEHPFTHLEKVIPDLNTLWLMVEDDQEENYPIYDCSPKVIVQILEECFGFEY